MNKDQLAEIAKAMVTGGKGILAADESSGTIKKRFDAIGVEFDAGEPARLSRIHVPLDGCDEESHFRRDPL